MPAALQSARLASCELPPPCYEELVNPPALRLRRSVASAPAESEFAGVSAPRPLRPLSMLRVSDVLDLAKGTAGDNAKHFLNIPNLPTAPQATQTQILAEQQQLLPTFDLSQNPRMNDLMLRVFEWYSAVCWGMRNEMSPTHFEVQRDSTGAAVAPLPFSMGVGLEDTLLLHQEYLVRGLRTCFNCDRKAEKAYRNSENETAKEDIKEFFLIHTLATSLSAAVDDKVMQQKLDACAKEYAEVITKYGLGPVGTHFGTGTAQSAVACVEKNLLALVREQIGTDVRFYGNVLLCNRFTAFLVTRAEHLLGARLSPHSAAAILNWIPAHDFLKACDERKRHALHCVQHRSRLADISEDLKIVFLLLKRDFYLEEDGKILRGSTHHRSADTAHPSKY
ncbi:MULTISPECIES: hypothetical protein [unclassified Undibacterium]|uniref:hypothetical protein n=2 Tax=Undibacterium TaxID=401469 RepID=UPI002AC9A778|nr:MULTISPECIES: hypothetical protein [unclassified Undibacterium]MEB0140377.1 hypothetical protein [Undibacterium sp. CCC2.1]MEB0173411.1 hypothetical protein [Undibacterium sp. CCC1.1]MEB0177311.1 hypothetical protein [Undibacterium sp. CCC3.4]WPX43470.1 hypothetical protein RHM61_19195 [Undibacterium sp. CCC3.4]